MPKTNEESVPGEVGQGGDPGAAPPQQERRRNRLDRRASWRGSRRDEDWIRYFRESTEGRRPKGNTADDGTGGE